MFGVKEFTAFAMTAELLDLIEICNKIHRLHYSTRDSDENREKEFAEALPTHTHPAFTREK